MIDYIFEISRIFNKGGAYLTPNTNGIRKKFLDLKEREMKTGERETA